jgi:cyclohexanone monooxygenase
MKLNIDVTGIVPFDPDMLHEKYMAERAKRLRPGSREYADIIDEFEDLDADPNVGDIPYREPRIEERDAIVVGGGLAGVVTGVRLRQAGIEDMLIIERGGDFGGAWYWNRYPGVRCDVESYIYIPLLEEVDTVPTERYAVGEEILAHCRRLGEKFRLYDAALFNTSVTSILWDEESQRWIVRTDRGDIIKARQMLVSNGRFHRAKLPRLAGLRDYRGKIFHSSRWDYDYTGGGPGGGLDKLADKRVALVGSGATALQILPLLAKDAGHVVMVQRTPAAVDARNNHPTDVDWYRSQPPGWQQERMDDFMLTMTGSPKPAPIVKDCWTDVVNIVAQWSGGGDPRLETASAGELQQLADYVKMEQIRSRIGSIVKNPETAEKLKPWFNLFCKRPGFSDEFLPTFNRSNVTLVDTEGRGIDRMTPDGFAANGEEFKVDCIIFATGFEVNLYAHEMGGYELIGRNGVSLADYWKDGMRSLHGVRMTGFPNLQIIGSVSQAAIAWNYPHVMTMQAEHAVRVAAFALHNDVAITEISAEDENAWLDAMEAAQDVERFEFFAECTPGYYNNEGVTTDRPPTFASAYGGGPVAYEAALRQLEARFQREAIQSPAALAS